MKSSALLVLAAVIAILALQGCAPADQVKYAPGAQPGAAPQTTASTPVVSAVNTKSDFEAVQAAVNQQMQPGGRFASVDAAGRATVSGRFQDMASLFDQYGSFDKMGPDARARIDGDQNPINAVQTSHDGNRLVCQDEIPIVRICPSAYVGRSVRSKMSSKTRGS